MVYQPSFVPGRALFVKGVQNRYKGGKDIADIETYFGELIHFLQSIMTLNESSSDDIQRLDRIFSVANG
jgi:hypothetical protein